MKHGMEDLTDAAVHIKGHRFLLVENYESIIEYTDFKVRLQAKDYRIQIEGRELMIEYFSDNEIQLTGRIEKVLFL